MVNAAYAIVAFPLLGFIINLVSGRRLGEPAAGWVGTVAAGGSFVSTLIVWVTMLGRPADNRFADLTIFTWFPVAGLHVNAGILVDPLSMTMALFVTGYRPPYTCTPSGTCTGTPASTGSSSTSTCSFSR